MAQLHLARLTAVAALAFVSSGCGSSTVTPPVDDHPAFHELARFTWHDIQTPYTIRINDAAAFQAFWVTSFNDT
ncbi:MAG: hypothetical protein ABI743_10710, partial [bacterium]